MNKHTTRPANSAYTGENHLEPQQRCLFFPAEERVTDEEGRRREQLLRAVSSRFIILLNLSADMRVGWHSTECDLVELCHDMWLTNQFRDHTGRSLTFQHIVKRVFVAVNRTPPSSPTSIVTRISNRKNIHTMPVMERYYGLMFKYHFTNPLSVDLKAM